jgi:D-glycero-D-manno-heptose 1,7-bisphosphate phosphatase
MALLDGLGLWCEIASGDYAGRPAIFLDRDGVIVEDVNYLGRAEDVLMLPGAAQAIGRCNRLGIPIVLVSNQSGVGRGYYGWGDFQKVQAALSAALATAGARIDAVLACAYHAEARDGYRIANHQWRKPNPGMILAAAERMKLDLANSWIVGDRSSDLAAGLAAGLGGGIIVTTNHNARERTDALALASEGYIVKVSATLDDAVGIPVQLARSLTG